MAFMKKMLPSHYNYVKPGRLYVYIYIDTKILIKYDSQLIEL